MADADGYEHHKSHDFTVEKDGDLKWKPRKKSELSQWQPKILVDNKEIQGLDDVGSLPVTAGQKVRIVEMRVKKPLV